MDEYVAVEAYDVMLGASYDAGGSNVEEGHASNTNGGSTASWDLATGITGQGWVLKGVNWDTFEPIYFDVYGTTDDEVRQKVVSYLNLFGGSYVSGTLHCS